MKKILIIFAGLAVLAAAVFVFINFSRERAAQAALDNLQTAPAGRGRLVAQVGASGTVRSNQSAILTWQTNGGVGSVTVSTGQQVSQGEVLANLDPTTLPQSVLMAQADLVNAQRDLERLLDSGLPQAQAQQALENAQIAYDQREDNLQARQAEAQLELINAQNAVTEAERRRNNLNFARASQATLDAAEADYILAQQEVDVAQSRFNEVSGRPDDDPVRALALSQLSLAKQRRDSALRTVNWYKGDSTEQEIAEADANVARAQARLVEAEQAWERIKDGLSQAEVSILQAQLDEARRDYERIRNGASPDDIAVAEARVAAAEATLRQNRITAPFDGTITMVNIKTGDQVTPGTTAFRLDDLSRLVVDVQLSEVDINQVEVGQNAVLTFDSILGREYRGQVVEAASVGQAEQGVVYFRVSIELIDADELVKPGMTSAVMITISELDGVLLTPNRAVRVVDGQRVVYVLRNGTPQPVRVTLGKSSDTQSEVIDGELREGDLIVLNPPAANTFGPGGGFGGGRP